MGGTECGSERAELASSAEGVFGASIARRDNQRDLIKRSESGSCRNEALERHSEALHIGRCGGVPCGTSEMFRTYASSRVLSTAIKPRPSRKCQIKRSAGGVNARRPCGTHGRSAAESVDAAEHRMKIHPRWASDLPATRRRDVTADRPRHHRVICSGRPAANRDESRAGLSPAFGIGS